MFAHYLAGCIDGDGWFNKNESVGIAFHTHDRCLALWIRDRIGSRQVRKEKELTLVYKTNSIGIVYIAWLVKDRLHHPKRVANMTTPVLTRTVRDKAEGRDTHTLMAEYGPPHPILPPFESNWFAGFVQTYGFFQTKIPDGIRVMVTIDRKDPYVLNMIHGHFGGGRCERYNEKYTSITQKYSSSSHANAFVLVHYFDVRRLSAHLGQKRGRIPIMARSGSFDRP